MIKIVFTCFNCGDEGDINADDIEGKDIFPVCDSCYDKFLSRKERLVKFAIKKLTKIYSDCGIPIETFNAGEEFSELP